VEEPVHHDEQDGDRQQPGGGLDVEARPAERTDDPDRQEPRGDRCGERDARTDGDRAAKCAIRADEAGRERSKHEHRLKPFAKDEQRAVDDDGAVTQVGARHCRIGNAVRSGDHLPGEGGDRRGSDDRPGGTAQQELAALELLGCRTTREHL
jgi:hypothetical protein